MARRSAERETFPPKWLLAVAVLAILVGTIWTGVRITAAEGQLREANREATSLGQIVDQTFCEAPHPEPLTPEEQEACRNAAEKAAQPTEAPAPFDPPKDGQDGTDGRDGKNGDKGDKGDKGDAGADATAPPAPPAPRDGKDGLNGADGADGTNGVDGQPGVDGRPGADGRGVADMHCQAETTGQWQVFYTDGTVDNEAGTCYTPPPAQQEPPPSQSPFPL